MTEITEFTRLYLAVFYSLVAAFYTARIVFLKRVTSSELIFPGPRGCTSWWNHLTFRIFRVLIWGVCVLRLFYPSADNYLGVIDFLQHPAVILAGIIFLTIGFVCTATVHFQLADAWRSGVDPMGPSRLVTSGVYQYSRNPMLLCVALSQLGFFLALPSFFTLICLFVGVYTINSQAKVEEKHLLNIFPSEYSLYKQKVRRWV